MANGALTKQFGRGMIKCAICRSDAYITGGVNETELLRSVYCCCSNIDCGMTWKMVLTFEHVISPTGLEGGCDHLPQAPPGTRKRPPLRAAADPDARSGQMAMFATDTG